MKTTVQVITLTLSLLAVSVVYAHDIWLQAERFTLDKGDTLIVHQLLGDELDSDGKGPVSKHVARTNADGIVGSPWAGAGYARSVTEAIPVRVRIAQVKGVKSPSFKRSEYTLKSAAASRPSRSRSTMGQRAMVGAPNFSTEW